MICEKCNGSGIISQECEMIEHNSYGVTYKVPGRMETEFCNKCLGSGELDWIEAIVGKKSTGIIDEWSNEAALNLSKEIDKEILKKIEAQYGL